MKIKRDFFNNRLQPFCNHRNPLYLLRDGSTNELKPVWDIYTQIKKIYDYEKLD